MDEETREALEMSPEELHRRALQGRAVDVAKSPTGSPAAPRSAYAMRRSENSGTALVVERQSGHLARREVPTSTAALMNPIVFTSAPGTFDPRPSTVLSNH